MSITRHRTKQDFAHAMRWLVDKRHPEANCIRVVLDNLNTHTEGAFYETFPAPEAHRIRKKLEFHYTPKHTSWLNMAEIELSVFIRLCFEQRMGDDETLIAETNALAHERNRKEAR